MDILQKNLPIIFRQVQPEMLFRSISCGRSWDSVRPDISVSEIGLETFQSLAHNQYPSYSYEEIAGIHQLLVEHMRPVFPHISSSPSVFFLLVRTGQMVLREAEDGLVCTFSKLLAWQNIYQNLGQDLFSTAFLAHEDIRRGRSPRRDFLWPPVLKTDNARLRAILRRGIAENHCHLGGTSQNFSLSWTCLMNCPFTIRLAASGIKQNLQANSSRGIWGNVWPWEKRLQWAAYLRIELFKLLEGISGADSSLHMEEQCFYPMLHIQRELRFLKTCYAAVSKDCPFPLDYALRRADCKDGLLKHHCRLLSGERSFLYRCFRACFDGTFSETIQNWFYLYLLIKENFRAELVQVNRQAGFRNFKDYQDRKDYIYDRIPAYRAEAVRLSVNANQQIQNITSFEARLGPRSSVEALLRQVKEYDGHIRKAGGDPKSGNPFYLYHFIKRPDPDPSPEGFLIRPRNYVVRNDSQRQAKALQYALRHNRMFCERVRGIDAANIEIHCRPETFAVEFRYLKDIRPMLQRQDIPDLLPRPRIHATYHAGEDFLDIADGLRTIDEAVKFLHLDRGDRIGHALALGVAPERHYRFKNFRVVLQKQDLLDNAVWLLYRSQEMGVDLSPRLYSVLQTEAGRLLLEIYGDCLQQEHMYTGLYEYYCSMQLRGDAPELYRVVPWEEPHSLLCGMYDQYRKDDRETLEHYRKSLPIARLCQYYHFDGQARKKGSQIVEFPVDKEYAALIRRIQDSLADELAGLGIAVECNPTSNYLIGTFRSYDAHPIFRFNNAGLIRTDGVLEPSAQLLVSINTDDLGIFDTSLENEYAVIAASLEHFRDGNGKRYTEDSIYAYLESVRRMGLEQAFLTL